MTVSLLLEVRAEILNPNGITLYPTFRNFPPRNSPYK